MKTVLMLVVAGLLVAPAAYALDIATVKAVNDSCFPVYWGYQVTIEGLVMSGDELGSAGPAYIEDATGGVSFYFYPQPFTTGDYVELTAYVDFYNGLIQLADDPVSGDPPYWTIISSGNPVVPHVITIPEMGELWEGSLVKFEYVMFPEANCVATFTGAHDFVDANDNVGQLYADSSTDVRGAVIPTGWINLTGCHAQYDTEGPDYCDQGYQVYPRSLADLEGGEPSATDAHTWSSVKAMYR